MSIVDLNVKRVNDKSDVGERNTRVSVREGKLLSEIVEFDVDSTVIRCIV